MLITIGQKPESDFDNPVGMLRDCHKRILYFLNTLAFAAKKFRGLPLPRDVQSAVMKSLKYFDEAAPKHNADEEESLFPRMRASAVGEAAVLMQTLEDEHRWAEGRHAAVDELFRAWIAEGSLGEGDSERLNGVLAELQGFYAEHIQHEEATIFPLAERGLSAEEIAAIGSEMAARRGVKIAQ